MHYMQGKKKYVTELTEVYHNDIKLHHRRRLIPQGNWNSDLLLQTYVFTYALVRDGTMN